MKFATEVGLVTGDPPNGEPLATGLAIAATADADVGLVERSPTGNCGCPELDPDAVAVGTVPALPAEFAWAS